MMSFASLDPTMSIRHPRGHNTYHIHPLTNISLSAIQRGRFKASWIDGSYGTPFSMYDPPPLELYTTFSLSVYFITFWVILFLQVLTILIVDKIWIRNVPKTARLWDRIIHAVQKSHFPFPYTNWYEGNGNPLDHVARYKLVKTEVLTTTIINLFFNMVLLVPLGILCKFSKFWKILQVLIHNIIYPFYRSWNFGKA